MATVKDGQVYSDDGEWHYIGDKGVRMWERIAAPAHKPGLAARLFSKNPGMPGLKESVQAGKLAGSLFDSKLGEAQADLQRRAQGS